jgi:hypothetical protein
MSKPSYLSRSLTEATIIIDENGQVLERHERITERLIKGHEAFSFLYAGQLEKVLVLNGSLLKTLLWCSMNTHLNTNEIVLNKSIKQRLSAATGLVLSSVDNALVGLCRAGLMCRVSLGVYMIDPQALWRGTVSEKARVSRVFEMIRRRSE